jgi:hypothetical protein
MNGSAAESGTSAQPEEVLEPEQPFSAYHKPPFEKQDVTICLQFGIVSQDIDNGNQQKDEKSLRPCGVEIRN